MRQRLGSLTAFLFVTILIAGCRQTAGEPHDSDIYDLTRSAYGTSVGVTLAEAPDTPAPSDLPQITSRELIDALEKDTDSIIVEVKDLTAATVPSVSAEHQVSWVLRPVIESFTFDEKDGRKVVLSFRLRLEIRDSTGTLAGEESVEWVKETVLADAGDPTRMLFIRTLIREAWEELIHRTSFRRLFLPRR